MINNEKNIENGIMELRDENDGRIVKNEEME